MKLEAQIWREVRLQGTRGELGFYLTVGVGVGATHHLPLVLKHLNPLVGPAQF